MEIYPDFKELLEFFNARKVEYLIVGGFALAHHGEEGATRNIDLYVRPSSENAQRVVAALRALGFGKDKLVAKDFTRPGQIILGSPPARVFIVTAVPGITWEEAAAGTSRAEYSGITLPFIGKAELIASKKAADRLQDAADAERLEGPPKKRKTKRP